ncbi:unnamed protein product [Miscanthus lutarioriparius]|uniref:Uncharacterized protein n=1 Tax=Miscanthus lutarioriparius TaxID=422564 RepID=A0A811PDY5_9POAL|nr:unnamed protein product [Miscanthus lutarioriparius]
MIPGIAPKTAAAVPVAWAPQPRHMFVFGAGFVGHYVSQRLLAQGWQVSGTCTSVTKKRELEMLGMNASVFDATESSEMRKEIERCKNRGKVQVKNLLCLLLLPQATSCDNNKRNKRGLFRIGKKLGHWKTVSTWMLSRAIYYGGVSFNFSRNPYLREAFTFACAPQYARLCDSGYNRVREGLQARKEAHRDFVGEHKEHMGREKESQSASMVGRSSRRPIINFVVVFDKAPMFLRADNCEGQYKSKEYIAEKLRGIIEERFVEVKTALQQMVISDKWSVYREVRDDSPTPTAQIIKDLILSDVWWDKVDYILRITTPIYEMIRMTDTDTPCLHLVYEIYYSKKWLDEGVGREPPHKDKEVSKMRMVCFKKFFPMPEELAKVKEEYSRNWSTYSFVHSVKRNALTPERAEDLVFVHSNLRHLSRRTDAYKTGETRMWDVGGGSFDSLGGIGILEVADLSLDEPELQAVSFGLDDL